MTNWLDFLGGAGEPPAAAGVIVVARAADADAPKLVGKARQLASDIGTWLHCVAVGGAEPFAALGCDEIHTADGIERDALEGFVRARGPELVLFGASAADQVEAGWLAERLGVADACAVDLDLDAAARRVVQRVAAYGGRAVVDVVTDTRPQVVALDASRLTAPAEDPSRRPTIHRLG